jgi:hypothetical protein
MIQLWDDRAVQVVENSGQSITISPTDPALIAAVEALRNIAIRALMYRGKNGPGYMRRITPPPPSPNAKRG